MPVLLQIDFPYNGPFGPSMTEAMTGLAQSIAKEPGLIWKMWTENQTTQEAGGIYLFDTQENAQAYLKMHSERLKAAGVSTINAKFFDVNSELSVMSKMPQAFLNH